MGVTEVTEGRYGHDDEYNQQASVPILRRIPAAWARRMFKVVLRFTARPEKARDHGQTPVACHRAAR